MVQFRKDISLVRGPKKIVLLDCLYIQHENINKHHDVMILSTEHY